MGVALATIIAQLIAGVGCMIYAWLKVPVFRIPLKECVPDKYIMKQCVTVGLPVAMQNALISVSCIVLQRVVNGFGPTILAAYTVASRFEQLVHQPFTS